MAAPPLLGYGLLHAYSIYSLIYVALKTPAKKPQKKKISYIATVEGNRSNRGTTQPKEEGVNATINYFEVDYLGSESFKWHSDTRNVISRDALTKVGGQKWFRLARPPASRK